MQFAKCGNKGRAESQLWAHYPLFSRDSFLLLAFPILSKRLQIFKISAVASRETLSLKWLANRVNR